MNIILVFVFVMLSVVISAFRFKKVSLTITLLMYSIIYSVMIATRSLEVPDSISYYNFFRALPLDLNFIYENNYSFESGYIFLNIVIKTISFNNYMVLFFLIAFINFWITFYGVSLITNKNYRIIGIIMVIFASYFGLYYSAMVLRQSIAFALLILSLGLFENRRIYSIFVALLAISFHTSAIIILLILVIYRFGPKLNRAGYLITIGFIILLYYSKLALMIDANQVTSLISRIPFFDYSKYYYLINFNMENSNWNLFLFLSGIMFSFFIDDDSQKQGLFRVYLVGLFFMALFRGISILERAIDYFLIISFVLHGISLVSIRNRIIRLILFIIIFAANLYVVLSVIGHFYL